MAKSKYDYSPEELVLIDKVQGLYAWIENKLKDLENYSIRKKEFEFIATHMPSYGKVFLSIKIDIERSRIISKSVFLGIHNVDANPEFDHRSFKSGISIRPQLSIDMDDFRKATEEWIQNAKLYDSLKLDAYFFSNEERYSNEFFDKLRLVDPSAEIEPFPLKIQLAIDSYLEDIHVITKNEQKKTREDYSAVIDAVKELRKTQAELSKNETLRKLSKIWAKARLKGIPFLKSLLTKAAEAFLVEIGKKLIGF